jgi:hypothetical protein
MRRVYNPGRVVRSSMAESYGYIDGQYTWAAGQGHDETMKELMACQPSFALALRMQTHMKTVHQSFRRRETPQKLHQWQKMIEHVLRLAEEQREQALSFAEHRSPGIFDATVNLPSSAVLERCGYFWVPTNLSDADLQSERRMVAAFGAKLVHDMRNHVADHAFASELLRESSNYVLMLQCATAVFTVADRDRHLAMNPASR